MEEQIHQTKKIRWEKFILIFLIVIMITISVYFLIKISMEKADEETLLIESNINGIEYIKTNEISQENRLLKEESLASIPVYSADYSDNLIVRVEAYEKNIKEDLIEDFLDSKSNNLSWSRNDIAENLEDREKKDVFVYSFIYQGEEIIMWSSENKVIFISSSSKNDKVYKLAQAYLKIYPSDITKPYLFIIKEHIGDIMYVKDHLDKYILFGSSSEDTMIKGPRKGGNDAEYKSADNSIMVQVVYFIEDFSKEDLIDAVETTPLNEKSLKEEALMGNTILRLSGKSQQENLLIKTWFNGKKIFKVWDRDPEIEESELDKVVMAYLEKYPSDF